MNENKEIRLLDIKTEQRAENDDKMIVEGYAVVYDSPATHDYTEIIDKNAFNTCDMSDVCLKYNHEDNLLIMARTRNNSLQLITDDKGLKIRAELIDTTQNRDIYKMVQAGLLDKMSFAFTVEKDEWDYETDTRRILSIDKLYDVSIVDVPFYDTTEVYARNWKSSKEEYEKRKKLKLEIEKTKLLLSL